MMEAGKSYGLAMISSNYGGGGTFRPWIQLPGETMEIMNPNASSQNGMYQVVRLSNGESLTTQTSLEANMTGLVPGSLISTVLWQIILSVASGQTHPIHLSHHPLDFSADGSYILENQPVGSLVGKLNTNAPDTNASIVYSLVSEAVTNIMSYSQWMQMVRLQAMQSLTTKIIISLSPLI